jgi:hypothetical protein
VDVYIRVMASCLVKNRDNFLPKRNRWPVLIYVGFEGLAAVGMKCTVLRNIISFSRLKVNRRFGGTYPLHFRGRISRAKRPA